MLHSIVFGNKAVPAGTGHDYRIPEGLEEPLYLISWFVNVSTDATIVTRELLLNITDKNRIQKAAIPGVFQQVATQQINYSYGPYDCTQPSSTVINAAISRLINIQRLPLEIGDLLELRLGQGQAGDLFTISLLQYESTDSIPRGQ